MVDKKKGEMTLATIIAIVLGITVLVFLIFGFSTGWNNMWGTIKEMTGAGGSNVDDVVRGCAVACSGQNTYAYCSQVRTVEFGAKKMIVDSGSSECLMGGSGEAEFCTSTCEDLSIITSGDASIGVAKCPDLC